jgi:hypothetical protein
MSDPSEQYVITIAGSHPDHATLRVRLAAFAAEIGAADVALLGGSELSGTTDPQSTQSP